MSKKINEATSTDLPVIQNLVNEYGWKVGDTLLYQQIYDLPENLKADTPISRIFALTLFYKT